MAPFYFKSALLVCTAVLLPCAQVSVRSFKGQAYEPGTTKILYSEKSELKTEGASPVSLRTEYRNPSGALIVERTLDFSRHVLKPDYRLTDLRDGYEEGADLLPGDGGTKKPFARVRVYVRDTREEPLREKILQVPEPCVIDGGFNVFIKAHWDELIAGQRVPFNFVAPARRDWFAFEAVPAGYDDASTFTDAPDAKGVRTFVIRPQNKALRLLVVPIRVAYDLETRHVTEYRGISNVNNAKGKSFKIHVAYNGLGP